MKKTIAAAAAALIVVLGFSAPAASAETNPDFCGSLASCKLLM